MLPAIDLPDGKQAQNHLGPALFGVALLAAGLVYFALLHRPLPWLLGVVPDDAYYYLQTARHLARTGASTFDGINPTNGYHPAWMLLMTLAAKMFPDRVGLLMACLTATFALHLAASLCLVAVLRHDLTPFWAWVGGACWLANPEPLFLALQGVEASLYLFTLTLLLLVYRARLVPRLRFSALSAEGPALPAGILVLFGLCLSLCFLARTEAALLAVIAIAHLLLATRRAHPLHPFLPCLRAFAATGGAFLAGILPWFLYSYLATGAVLQRSGAMKLLWAAEAHAHFGLGRRVFGMVGYLLSGWLSYPILNAFTDFAHQSSILVAPALIATLVLLRRAFKSGRHPDLWTHGLWLFAATLLTGCVYGFFYADRQPWYRAQPALILFYLGFLWAVRSAARSSRQPSSAAEIRRGVAFVALALLLCARLYLWPPVLSPWQRDVYVSQRRFQSLVPPEDRIGCFNAGIPAYFTDRTVINLDGLANNTLYPYFRARRFDRYLQEHHIAYIADEEASLERASRFARRPLPIRPLLSMPLTGWDTDRRWLWKVTFEEAGK
jgi:hypothetical protein